jgi:hypothetical protein
MSAPLVSASRSGSAVIGAGPHGDTITEKKEGGATWSSSCSRNARPLKGLVRRAHSRIDQVAPVEGNEQAWMDQLDFVRCAQWKINQPPSLRERAGLEGQEGGKEWPGALLARRTRTVKLRSSDARSEGQPGHSLEREGAKVRRRKQRILVGHAPGEECVEQIVIRVELLYIQPRVYVGHPEGHCQFRETRCPIRRGGYSLR